MLSQNKGLTLVNSCAKQNRSLSHSWKSGIEFTKEPVGFIIQSESSDQLSKGWWKTTD